MSNISWMYNNLGRSAISITDYLGTSNSKFGTSNLCDNDLNTSWNTDRKDFINDYFGDIPFRVDETPYYFIEGSLSYGTANLIYASVTFDFGSAVYVDSLIVVHNMDRGTMYFNAGNGNPPAYTSYGMPVLNSTGTSINYIDSVTPFRYWQLFAGGDVFDDVIKINEVFIGKRIELPINPEWPFNIETNVMTIDTQSQSGHKYIYRKYDKTKWNFLYNGLDQTEFDTLNNIRSFCNNTYLPFWMCIDRDYNKFDTKFVRFSKGSWKYSEVAYKIYDINFSVEEEL